MTNRDGRHQNGGDEFPERIGAHTQACGAIQDAERNLQADIPILQQTVGGLWKKGNELKQLKLDCSVGAEDSVGVDHNKHETGHKQADDQTKQTQTTDKLRKVSGDTLLRSTQADFYGKNTSAQVEQNPTSKQLVLHINGTTIVKWFQEQIDGLMQAIRLQNKL